MIHYNEPQYALIKSSNTVGGTLYWEAHPIAATTDDQALLHSRTELTQRRADGDKSEYVLIRLVVDYEGDAVEPTGTYGEPPESNTDLSLAERMDREGLPTE